MSATIHDYNQAVILRESRKLELYLQRLTVQMEALISLNLMDEASLLKAHIDQLTASLAKLMQLVLAVGRV